MYWKDKNKEKEAGDGPFYIKFLLLRQLITKHYFQVDHQHCKVTRFDEISPLWQFFKVNLVIGKTLILSWQKIILLGNFSLFKWPKTKKVMQLSDHTVVDEKFASK